MADTLQAVNWFLEYTCPFRQLDAVDRFVPAYNATGRLRAIDACEAKGDLIGEVCVTGVSFYKGEKSPCSGFRVSDAVAPVGSLDAARQTCRACPANACSPVPGTMAGCCGFISLDPDDRELDKSLHSAVDAAHLRGAYAQAFPRTDPLWYGLWISSPLTSGQLDVLRRVLPHVTAKRESLDETLTPFVRACEQSLRHGIPLHVNLPPLGHTDLGYVITFPHCPRCKKGYRDRWEKHSTRQASCPACGHVYVPAATAKDENDSCEPDDLKALLSPEEYQALRTEWERRHANDAPSHLDLMIMGKWDALRQPPWWSRLWGRFRR